MFRLDGTLSAAFRADQPTLQHLIHNAGRKHARPAKKSMSIDDTEPF
jgi:hypothetical protein